MVDAPKDTLAGIPLLETKLYIPKRRHGLVSRPRLIERMHQAIERKITLVSAPAGFGKTTLLADCLASDRDGERAAGWISLDQRDNEPALFWAYVIAALRKVHSEVGEAALALLHSPQPAPIESVLTTLINEIDAIEEDFVLVLDDYHVIEAEPIHSAVTFLLDHLPPQMHLVIASRSDPPLPLARLRGRGELTELRTADLRFTPNEASAFLNHVMGLNLSPADVAALETRTEGWIAGLQLAALSMQGHKDVHGFIAAFSGDNRYIADFLVEEVLCCQPERVRSFLLQTSILERLSGPLCDAVTGHEESSLLLESLVRGNLFVVPLDDKRTWYRYHHLFSDVLQAHLMEDHPDLIPALHRRASEWYEHAGSTAEAVRHALTAEDFERAARLIELAWPAMDRVLQSGTWLRWAEALPEEIVRVRPVLRVGYAWALLDAGEFAAGNARLQEVERWLNATLDISKRLDTPSDEMVVADLEQFRSLPATIASAHAYHAQALGDADAAVTYARKILDLAPADDYFGRGQAAGILALAYWASGDLDSAATHADTLRLTGNVFMTIGSAFMLADVRVVQGRLNEAVVTYTQALQLAVEQGKPCPGTSDLHVGLSEVLCERGDLEAALQHLLTGKELGEPSELTGTKHRWFAAMARIKAAEGELDGALSMLDEAERLYVASPIPDVRPLAAQKIRILIAQGRLAEARDRIHQRGLTVEDDLSFLREFEHITLARLLIARSNTDRAERSIHDAITLLDRLAKAAEEGRRMGSLIEILALQALAGQVHGNVAGALDPLERALTLAQPEGYFRRFVDEGKAMRDLLRHATARGIAGSYARRLLAAFDEPAQPGATSARIAAHRLVTPLTTREVEILRLISTGMKNQEIADHLFISLSTVKRHIANAYGKMNVRHRTEALALANELNLL